MPLHNYGVLKGRPIGLKREHEQVGPHFQIHTVADGVHYRLSVNVKSLEKPSELLFFISDDFRHPLTDQMQSLPEGFTALQRERRPGGIALDYLRGNLFSPTRMRPIPCDLPGPENDLCDRIEHYAKRALMSENAVVYAFGERWGPEKRLKDKIFHFRPGNGIHDIHMNQGNDPRYRGDDGVWQDGGLFFYFPETKQWVAIFLAFQSQSWHTDDSTGHRLDEAFRQRPSRIAGPAEPFRRVRIVAALVNPIGPDAGKETVTLLNTSPERVELDGWAVMNKLKQKFYLEGTIEGGETLKIHLPPEVQLGNDGGLITLLDRQGLKVHGVSYTAAQAQAEGWTVVF